MDAVLLKALNGTQLLVLRSKECKCNYKLHYEVRFYIRMEGKERGYFFLI